MKRWIGITLVGLLSFVIALAVYLPAAQAYSWFGQQLPVQVYGLHGTIWDGSAEAITHGQQRVDAVRWTIHPWSLVTGKLAVDIRGRLPDGKLTASLAAAPGGRIEVRDLRADASVNTVLNLAGRGALTRAADGHVEALLRSATIEGQRLLAAEGILNWNGAKVGLGELTPLGNLGLRLEPAEQGVDGELVSQEGVMDISGNVHLDPNGTYQVRMRMAPRDPDNPQAQRFINMLRLANPRGPTIVTITGNLQGGSVNIRQRSG